jgi:DNA-directed RNA polymerase, subunit RPC10 (contains C4-type Zn-finger)
MGLISLKCSNCSGEIQLDERKEFGFCMHCGHKVILQESIIKRVEIDNSRIFSNWIQLGLKALESFNYQSAENYGEKILEQDIDSGMGWYLKACGAMDDINRRTEAYNCFETAAQKMSESEKKEHGVNFIFELISNLEVDCRDGGGAYLDDDAMIRCITTEENILHILLDDLDSEDEIDILKGLYEGTVESEWTFCWKAMSLIQAYSIDAALGFAWSFHGKELMKLLVKVGETLSQRFNELPSERMLTIHEDTILEIRNKSLEFIKNNLGRIRQADKLCIEDKDNEKIQTRIDRGYEKAEPILDEIIEQIQASYYKKIGKNAARLNAINRYPSAWNIIIDEIISQGKI